MTLTCKEQMFFSEMTWQEFENYVIDVLNVLYRKNNIKIKKTSDRNDGGRDGYAVLHIDSQICSEADDSLSYNALFWVEVKKRTSTNLGEVGIGGNVLLALEANVNKLIFISNRDFTIRAKEVCSSVAKRLNTSVSFINGEKLTMLADNANKTIGKSVLKVINENVLNENYVSVVTGFVSDQEHALCDSILSINTGDSVFWICEIAGAINKETSFIKVVTNNSLNSAFSCECLSKDSVKLDSIETVHRIIFCITVNQPGEYSCKDILQEFKTGKEITIEHVSSGSILNVKHSILNNSLPQNRKKIVDNIVADFNILLKEKRVRGCLLEATAGSGKTFLINNIRQRITPIRVREIYLDGAMHRGVADIAKSLTSQLFPVPVDLSSYIDLSNLKKWISSENYSESKQDRIFTSLFAAIKDDFENTFDVHNIVSALALILVKSSKNKPIVLIFEDLHKVNTTVLFFIRNLVAQVVSRKEGVIYFMFSSRPHSESNEGKQIEWLQALNELCGEVVHFSHSYINFLEQHEAIELIEQSLKGVSKHEAYSIVEQVGTNPYNLKEALLYLESIEAIERNPIIGSFIINSAKVKDAIHAKVLQSSTQKRLQILIKKEGADLQKLLISAACLGKFFSLEIAKIACPNIRDDNINTLITICEKYNIFRFSNLPFSDSKTNCGFDHDLIRLAVLQSAGTFALKQISNSLINNYNFPKDSKNLLYLSYLSGNSNLCQLTANTLVKKTINTKSYQETLSYSLISLAIILRSGNSFDKSGFLRLYLNKIDESFRFADIPQLKQQILPETLMDALLTPLEIMSKIGTFEKELSEKLITLGGINSEVYPKSHHKSSFKYYEGKLFFGQSKYSEALNLFKTSEEIWYMGKDARDELLSKIRVWKSICERMIGNLDKAKQEMQRALKLRNRDDWELLSQVSANLGAFYMYDNQTIAERHWKRGLRIAKNTDNYDEIAHFLNDLGHIDIMLNNYSEAIEKVSQAASVAEKYGIIKETIRSNIFLGCIYIVENKLEIGGVSMKNAENEAFLQYNLRRLWRIHANLATIAELEGRIEDAYVKDRQSLTSMPILNEMAKVNNIVKRQTRVSGALVNIIERYNKAPYLYSKIKQLIPSDAWEYGIELQQTLSKKIDTNKSASGIQTLYKNIKGTSIWRFIITE